MVLDRDKHIADCERLYQDAKTIVGDLKWERTYNNGANIKGTVAVTTTGEWLTLRGAYRPENYYSIKIGLYYKKKYPIRVLHFHDGHHNPGGQEVDRAHKHQPTKNYITDPKVAYGVPELNEIEDPNQALGEFLKECKIECHSEYHPILL